MPYKDDVKRRAYFRKYFKKRRDIERITLVNLKKKQEKLLKQKEYSRIQRELNPSRNGSKVSDYVAEVFEFKSDDYSNVCSKFGCGRKLSLIEGLAGNKCTKHM